MKTKYIYERNPDTGEIFRRKYGDFDSPRELINKTKNMNNVSLYDYLGHAAFLDLYFKGGLNEGTTGKQLLKG